MLGVELSNEAEQDLITSFNWYETQKAGLGERFLGSIESALQIIQQFPGAFQVVFRRVVRSYPVSTFPFTIYYVIGADYIDVISVFHSHRNPKVWKKRV